MGVDAGVGAAVGVDDTDCDEPWDCAPKEPGQAASAMGNAVARKTIRLDIIPSPPNIFRARAVLHPQIHLAANERFAARHLLPAPPARTAERAEAAEPMSQARAASIARNCPKFLSAAPLYRHFADRPVTLSA